LTPSASGHIVMRLFNAAMLSAQDLETTGWQPQTVPKLSLAFPVFGQR
jgi:hypothetical protein